MQAAKSRGTDVLLIDTAGRLHTKIHLVEELKKIRRVITREQPDAPHETLLVMDATTGQNALQQARVFKEAADITGIVLTKLDGTAKGGVIISIQEELAVPVKYIGIGEEIEDLQVFDPASFARALLEN
jgi:fused signal recognition particle receptor